MRDAEAFMNEIMNEEASDDSMDDIQLNFCQNMRNGKCTIGDSCTKFHPVEEMEDDDPENEQKCNICLEGIKSRGRRFGLLDQCDHAFCLECIREWRTTYIKN